MSFIFQKRKSCGLVTRENFVNFTVAQQKLEQDFGVVQDVKSNFQHLVKSFHARLP